MLLSARLTLKACLKKNEKLKKEIKHLKDDFESLNDIF